MNINQKKPRRAEEMTESRTKPQSLREAWACVDKKIFFSLLINCVVFVGIYRLLISGMFTFTVQQVTVLTYMIGAAVLVLAYVIYNRGFSGRGITAEMLPDSMTEKEKDDYIADTAERERKSKWMMTVIIPLLLALLTDLIDVFVIQNLIS